MHLMLYQRAVVSLLLLSAIEYLSGCLATTYKVIALAKDKPVTDIGVMIDDGDVYRMNRLAPGGLLYQINAPNAVTGYKYVHINRNTQEIQESEPFMRPPLASDNNKNETMDDKDDDENSNNSDNDDGGGINEFYGRSWTYRDLKAFKPIHAFPQDYNRISTKHLHPENEIPTIHIQAPTADIDRLHGYYMQDIDIRANMTYITSKKVLHFVDTKFKLGGRSTRHYTKLAYNINLPKKTYIDKYRKLKLRAMGADPSYIREKLGYDMLSAAGRPTTQDSFVRLFINDRAIGLFSLVQKYDDNFLRNEFGGGKKSYKSGILYQGIGATRRQHRADLGYLGNDPRAYENSAYEIAEKPAVGNKTFDHLIQFTKFIDDQLVLQKNKSLDLNSTVETWYKHLDVNGFMINMAFDFLWGHFDDYIQNTNNYFMYLDPVKQRFVYLTWDLDMSMGSGPVKMRKIVEGNYRKYLGMEKRPLTRATLMNIPHFQQLFEHQLAIIVNQLFQPSAVNPVIDSLVHFLADDVEWDRSLPRVRKGVSFINWGPHNFENWFHNNSTGKTVSTPLSLSLITSADFLIRVNADIPLGRAIDGPTHHSSLYALKNWYKEKTDNVRPFIDPPKSH